MCISFLCDISFSISLVQPECRSHKCWTTEGWPDADQATKILTGSKLNPDDPDDEMSYDALRFKFCSENDNDNSGHTGGCCFFYCFDG